MKTLEATFEADFVSGKLFWKTPPKHHPNLAGKEAGFINVGKGKNKTYWQVKCGGRTYKRARIIFYMAHGRWPEPFVDHINANSLDDRLVNLRECSIEANSWNRSDRVKNSGMPKGVDRYHGSFRARITHNKRRIILGAFSSAEEAHRAYVEKRKELFGEYA